MMKRSPCEVCRKVENPQTCDNKDCGPWRTWFLQRWEQIHGYGRMTQRRCDSCGGCCRCKEGNV